MKAAVVGAGFAGLVAARELAAGGVEVDVFEARDRVGGRVHSRRTEEGAVIEMGAEFILPGNTLVRETAEDLGLGLWDKGMRYGRREPRGGPLVDETALGTALELVTDELGTGRASSESVRSLLDRLELDPGARAYMLARSEVSAATAAENLPADQLLGLAHIGDDPSPSVAGGNQGIALGLAERLGKRVRLGRAVTSVRWSAGAAVVSAGGESVEVDALVVAVPATVLGRIRFDPPLPDAQRAAFDALTYGHAAKLFVPLEAPPEPRAVMSTPERYWAWTATGEGDRPQPLVSCFAGSPAGLARLDVAKGPGSWLESLRALRPDLDLEPARDRAVLSTWSDDEWVQAAYSVSPGPAPTAAMTAPCGPIHFAGEHTAGEFSALMEGALRSGRRAAREILRGQT